MQQQYTDNQILAKKYLTRIRDASQQIRNTVLEIEALEYAASGTGAIRYDKEHVDGGSGEDRLIIFVSDALAKRAELEEMIAEAEELKEQCYRIIKEIESSDERIILEWHYINAQPMLEIVRRLCVSERKAYYILGEALEHFGEMLTF